MIAAVDARGRDEDADAVDREQRQREEDPPAQLRNLADVLEAGRHAATLARGGARGGFGAARRSARPCRRPSRSSPWRTPRTRCALTIELLRQLALAEDLHRLEPSAAPCPAPCSAVDGRPSPGSKRSSSVADVDREDLRAERVLEAALREAALHRHLAALEAEARAVVAGAGLLALDALAGLSCRCPSRGPRPRRLRLRVAPCGSPSACAVSFPCRFLSPPVSRPSPGARPSRIMPRTASVVVEHDRLVPILREAEALDGPLLRAPGG